MSELTVQIKQGDFEYPHEENTIISGGMSEALFWEEYLELFTEDTHERLKLIRKCIEENHLVATTADKFCNDNYFQFSDDLLIAFSWRAWGDLMSAIVGKKEGYQAYYM